MMFGNLLGQRTLELRLFPPQNTEGKRRQRFGIALPRQQGDEPPAPAAAQQIRDDAGELDIGILQDFDDPVVRPGAALNQGPRVHVRSGGAPLGGGGRMLGRMRPCAKSSAIQRASALSVLGPGRRRISWAWPTSTSAVPTSMW